MAEHGRRAQLSNEFRLKIQELSIANGTVVAALGQKLCNQHVPAGANAERGCNKRDASMHVRVVKAGHAIASEWYSLHMYSRVATTQAEVRWECSVYMYASLEGRSCAYVKVKAHACMIEANSRQLARSSHGPSQ